MPTCRQQRRGCHGPLGEVSDFCDGEQAVLIVHRRNLSVVVGGYPAVIGEVVAAPRNATRAIRFYFCSDIICSRLALRRLPSSLFEWRLAQLVGAVGGGFGRFGSRSTVARLHARTAVLFIKPIRPIPRTPTAATCGEAASRPSSRMQQGPARGGPSGCHLRGDHRKREQPGVHDEARVTLALCISAAAAGS